MVIGLRFIVTCFMFILIPKYNITAQNIHIRGLFEKLVGWRQCSAVMQREAMTYVKL